MKNAMKYVGLSLATVVPVLVALAAWQYAIVPMIEKAKSANRLAASKSVETV